MRNKSHLEKPVTGAGTDTTAIHDDVAGEINAISVKATPVAADVLLAEDSEDSWGKKKIEWGSVQSEIIKFALVFGG